VAEGTTVGRKLPRVEDCGTLCCGSLWFTVVHCGPLWSADSRLFRPAVTPTAGSLVRSPPPIPQHKISLHSFQVYIGLHRPLSESSPPIIKIICSTFCIQIMYLKIIRIYKTFMNELHYCSVLRLFCLSNKNTFCIHNKIIVSSFFVMPSVHISTQ